MTVTTIDVPSQTSFDEACRTFDEMASNLLSAMDPLRRLSFEPGAFAQADALREGVDAFCRERIDKLTMYSEAFRRIGETLLRVGELYAQSERERCNDSANLEDRIRGTVQGLQGIGQRPNGPLQPVNGSQPGAGGGGTTPSDSPDGYAATGEGTTGGGNGPSVTVTSLEELQRAVAGDSPANILVQGHYTGGSDIKVGSNKTIIGVGKDSGLTGAGLNLTGVSNVIIRNLKIDKVANSSGTGDAIHIEGSHHVWIDHNDLSSDLSHGKDYYDGLVDITRGSDYVTVSWNVIHDHYKASLVGHSDGNQAEDKGALHVTYHHNLFKNIKSRMPSLRFGTGHVYDNYFQGGGSTGVHSRMGAQMLVQNNAFEGIKTPIETTKDSTVDGFVNLSGNTIGGGSNLITQIGSLTNPGYSYKLDPTGSVITLVLNNAGTGVIN